MTLAVLPEMPALPPTRIGTGSLPERADHAKVVRDYKRYLATLRKLSSHL